MRSIVKKLFCATTLSAVCACSGTDKVQQTLVEYVDAGQQTQVIVVHEYVTIDAAQPTFTQQPLQAGGSMNANAVETGGSTPTYDAGQQNTGGTVDNVVRSVRLGDFASTGGSVGTGGSLNSGGTTEDVGGSSNNTGGRLVHHSGGSTSTGGAVTDAGSDQEAGVTFNVGGSVSNVGGSLITQTGGSNSSGGSSDLGSAPNSGGTLGTGGTLNSGGTDLVGGSSNTGGTVEPGSGGNVNVGGASLTGGSNSGGTLDVGGTTVQDAGTDADAEVVVQPDIVCNFTLPRWSTMVADPDFTWTVTGCTATFMWREHWAAGLGTNSGSGYVYSFEACESDHCAYYFDLYCSPGQQLSIYHNSTGTYSTPCVCPSSC